ncbi:agmatine coumaroyltransferase-2-like [Hordeum vulgare subsp. vulgare]|uniref:Agmatine coumaroyltransferase-2 n=1 Tax=Hordeum vulgare subsp. vulgare TaxID=112509 RepID=A0A8I6Y8S7_HORVV|nr:agmatine coumaroyltransferase-2-like [Hordeum vulgare subsp. vulgare]
MGLASYVELAQSSKSHEMKITVQSSKSIKPDYGGHRPVAPPFTANAVPLSVFDKANLDTHVSVIYAFHPPAPPNDVLEAGLARALVEYRQFAGRLARDADGSRSAILLNDAGARFVEATAGVSLGSVMPLQPTPAVLSLHPSGGDELMLLQATRFACGSLVVGITVHHKVTDGRGFWNFMLAWGQATRGAAVDPVPVHDRPACFPPRSPPMIEHEHRGVEFKPHDARKDHDAGGGCDGEVVVVERVHFSAERIAELKAQASAGARYSTVQCVLAHLWPCVTRARGLGGRDATALLIGVDGRRRMSPPVPDWYPGNVVLWARPTATAGELVDMPLRRTAELIGRAVARVDDAYCRSFIDFACSGTVEAERLVPTADAADMVLSPNVEVNSWVRLPHYDLDLGGGRPFLFMPSYVPVEGVVFLVPSFVGGGSVDAYVSLFRRDRDAFRNCCTSGLSKL